MVLLFSQASYRSRKGLNLFLGWVIFKSFAHLNISNFTISLLEIFIDRSLIRHILAIEKLHLKKCINSVREIGAFLSSSVRKIIVWLLNRPLVGTSFLLNLTYYHFKWTITLFLVYKGHSMNVNIVRDSSIP